MSWKETIAEGLKPAIILASILLVLAIFYMASPPEFRAWTERKVVEVLPFLK